MSTRRTAAISSALCAGAVLLAAVATSAPAAPGAGSGTRVVLRFSENERSGAAPISGTFTASGGISDRGTAVGTHYPVYAKVHGKVDAVAIDLVQRQKGTLGSFVLKCRDNHFVFNRTHDQIVRATGRCAIASATGPYAHLQPVATAVLVPSHPRKGFTHTVRLVTVQTQA